MKKKVQALAVFRKTNEGGEIMKYKVIAIALVLALLASGIQFIGSQVPVATAQELPSMAILFDADGNGLIQKQEAILAVNSYFFHEKLTKAETISVVNTYLLAQPVPSMPSGYYYEDGAFHEISEEMSEEFSRSLKDGTLHKDLASKLGLQPKVETPECGDGICEKGETSDTCSMDCGCPSGEMRMGDVCVVAGVTVPPAIIVHVPQAEVSYEEPQYQWVCRYDPLMQRTVPCKLVESFKGLALKKYGDDLEITVEFMSSEELDRWVRTHAAPKIYFDTDGDTQAEIIVTLEEDQFSVQSSGATTLSGDTTCTGSACTFRMPWATVFGTADEVEFWMSHAFTEPLIDCDDLTTTVSSWPLRARIPSSNALRLKWSTFELEKVKDGTPYIVIVLDSVKVIDDEDPAAEGEIMFLLTGKSGDIEQQVAFPMRIWYEMNDNDTILEGRTENRVPIFAAPESELDDALAITISAIDSNELPAWLVTSIHGIGDKVLAKAGEALGTYVAGKTGGEIGALLGEKIVELVDWGGDNEEIGTHAMGFTRDEDWGVRDESYQLMSEDIVVEYSVKRVHVPDDLEAQVKLYGIKILDHSDCNTKCGHWYGCGGGEFFAWMRVADGFIHEYLDTRITRCPDTGTHDICNNRVRCPQYDRDDFGSRPEYITLFNGNIDGPFLFVEIGTWDEDCPDCPWNDDHDPLGTLAKTWVLDESFFHWELDRNVPSTKTINRMEEYKGVSGGKVKIDLGVTIEQQ